jgi:anthranilate synthase component 1
MGVFMMQSLSFSEFQALAKLGNVVPVYATHLADLLTPVSALMRLLGAGAPAFLLESVEGGEKYARYSFLGCGPFMTVESVEGRVFERRERRTTEIDGNIFHYLNQAFAKYRGVRADGLPRFTGGAVGYLSYESVRFLEKISTKKLKNLNFPDAHFMFFDTVLVFDHFRHLIYIVANAFLDESRSNTQAYDRALEKISAIEHLLKTETAYVSSSNNVSSTTSANFSEADFCSAVLLAQEYIRAGDIFQVVLSQKFQRKVFASPLDIYRALRLINPSPYLYFVKMNDTCIIGSSPELLARVEDGTVEVRPIAGTRPRGKDADEDDRLAQSLLNDEKEIAEHVMLVDLGRNDVGRIAEAGSVNVNQFRFVEKYSHVMHMVSNVSGKLRTGISAIDALSACFPAGTVSGAPKIRAMQIISELEPEGRGLYAGAIGYIDFCGNLDTCIAIRTIVTQGDQAYFQAGAGIVADSVPAREYQETLHKAAALQAAIDFAERGLA